jgi:hypothetical protein
VDRVAAQAVDRVGDHDVDRAPTDRGAQHRQLRVLAAMAAVIYEWGRGAG